MGYVVFDFSIRLCGVIGKFMIIYIFERPVISVGGRITVSDVSVYVADITTIYSIESRIQIAF